MHPEDREFQLRLFKTFKEEAREHVQAISAGVAGLEHAAGAELDGIIETIFREAHTLKGAARSVGVKDIEAVCQSLESVFAAARRGDIVPAPDLWTPPLQRAVDELGRLLEAIGPDPSARAATPAMAVSRQLDDILRRGNGGAEASTHVDSAKPVAMETSVSLPSPPAATGAETVRVPSTRLNAVLLQSEGLLSIKLTAAQRATEMRDLHSGLARCQREASRLQPELRQVQAWLDRGDPGDAAPAPAIRRILEFVADDRETTRTLEARAQALARSAANDERTLGSAMDSMVEDLTQVLMLPCASALESFPGMVRELARAQGKDIAFEIHGADLEVDRRVLDEIKVALLHLLRNAVDHGIEPASIRADQGKPRRGRIAIDIVPLDGRRVEMRVSDDGAGLDTARVRVAAIRAGAVTVDEAARMDEAELDALILCSGVSTSAAITDISGRGLGMAIAREKAEKLGGTLSMQSKPGAGMQIRIVLPLSMARFNGMLVRAGGSVFVLPLTGVERGLRVKKADITTVENGETVAVGNERLPLLPLAELLELPLSGPAEGSDYAAVVVLAAAGQRLACQVDDILGTQEVLVKGLGPQLERVRNVAAATTLGSGRVVPILNVADLMKSAATAGRRARQPAPAPAAAARRKILVVEDSVTSRTLLKNILETAGYEVETAVDGVDGFTRLRAAGFDLVVSDVEMPRMGGFDLTARIRADDRLGDLPVVLVTSLDSAADRERGLDAGANAYLVKSDFQQENLLETLRRLV